LSASSRTPACWTAATSASISSAGGTASGQGHQSSIAENPAARAAAGRASSGSSVNSIEQLTA
jgi:hypothetical protein